jgi:hypothetical protein
LSVGLSPFPPAFACSVKVPPEGSKKQGPRRTERAVSSLLRTRSIFQANDLRNCNFCHFTWRKPPLINAPKFNVAETCSFWIPLGFPVDRSSLRKVTLDLSGSMLSLFRKRGGSIGNFNQIKLLPFHVHSFTIITYSPHRGHT